MPGASLFSTLQCLYHVYPLPYTSWCHSSFILSPIFSPFYPVSPLFASFFWVQTCPMEMKTGIKTLRSQVRSVPSPSYPVHTCGKITTGPCHCLRDCQQVPTISDKECSEFCTFLPTECLSHGFGTTVVPPLAPCWSKLLNRNQKWSSRTSKLLFCWEWGEYDTLLQNLRPRQKTNISKNWANRSVPLCYSILSLFFFNPFLFYMWLWLPDFHFFWWVFVWLQL